MLRVLSLAVVATVALADGTWGPADTVHALDGVIGAVEKIVHLPHLSATQLEEAKKIAVDIKVDVEAVESGKLTKEQAHVKVGEGMKELAAFAAKLQMSGGLSERRAQLEKQLHEKEAALAKLEKQMKLLKLKKLLAEKRLAMQNLLAAKAAGQDRSAADDAKATAAVVTQLHGLKDLKGADAMRALQTVQQQEKAVGKRLARLDAGQKKSEDMMTAAMQGELKSAASGKDALEKGKKMVQELEKREERKFAKVRAGQQIELEGLKEVEASLKGHDGAGLQKSLQKLDQLSKSTQAKSGKFLY